MTQTQDVDRFMPVLTERSSLVIISIEAEGSARTAPVLFF
jgi:hypothetical protein